MFGQSLIGWYFWETEFLKLNPMKFVPALVDDDAVIGDSYAIALASIEILAFVNLISVNT